MNVVESEVVDVWIDRTLWLLIGVLVGLLIKDRPIDEMAIMLERLNHRYSIDYLEQMSRDRTLRQSIARDD